MGNNGDEKEIKENKSPNAGEKAETKGGTPVTDLVPQQKTELQLKAEKAVELAKNGEVNAFFAVYLTLASMNQALKDADGRPPRWVRIARVGDMSAVETKERPVGKVVYELTGVFLKAMGYFTELTLRAFDLLKDIDGGKALVEVGAEMLETMCGDKIVQSIAYSLGAAEPPGKGQAGDTSFDNPLQSVVGPVRTAKKVLRYVPGYEDVMCVGQELFNLMKIEQKTETEIVNKKFAVDVDWQTTGKLRLISWAINKPIPIFSSGKDLLKFTPMPDFTYLGRRVIKSIDKPEDMDGPKDVRLPVTWPSRFENNKTESWNVYELDYAKKDIVKLDTDEINAVLDKLQYPGGTLKIRLQKFQENNKLDEDGGKKDGELDNHTIHRLMNMDYKNKYLKRAIGAGSVTDPVSIIRAIVRDELKSLRLGDLGVVTSVFPHADGDENNYECNLKLREADLELRRVPMATPHIGMVSTPRVGDLVLVSYVGADPDRPIVIGRLYSDQANPPVHEENEWRVESPFEGETSLAIDKEESVIVSAGKTTVTVNKDGSIEATGEEDLKIQVNGNVEIKCADCKIDASGNVVLGSGGGGGVITEKSHKCYFTGAALVGSKTVKAKG